ncbi:MAG: LysM peptidoglycan-binding domain-containing protein [Pseudomonadota bacterium]
MTDVVEIKKGDTLSGLARQHNTSVKHLAATNGISDPNKIYAGDPLVVPAASPPPMTQAPAQPKPPATESAPQVPSSAPEGVDEGARQAGDKPEEPPAEAKCNCEEGEEKESERAKYRLGGDENTDVIYADARGKAEGGVAEGSIGAGMVRMEHEGKMEDAPLGGSHNLDMMNAEAAGHAGIGYGAGARGKAEARMVKQGGTVFVGNDMNNPLAEAGGEYELMSAEAKGDVLLGSDGKRRGVALGGGATAAAAKGDVKGSFSIPIPFTNWTIGGAAKGGGSAGSVGLAGGAHAFQDVETGRVHLGLGGEIAALLGLKFNFDLSIGPKYTDRKRPHGP